MPILASRRSRRGAPSFPVKCNSVIVWLAVILATSYQAGCTFRRWRASTAIVFRGTTGTHLLSRPVIAAWTEIYAHKNQTRTSKPRTWPENYESFPVSHTLSVTAETHGAAENVTLHKLREFPPDCKPRSEWHTFTFPTCSLLHEIDHAAGLEQQRVRYGSVGATRESWLLESFAHTTTILKTLRFRETYDELIYEKQRIDALVSERLTASPHVIDIYGFCGVSVLNEFADEGMFASAFRHKYSDGGNYTDKELLVFARDAALGLADIHGIDGHDNITSFIHHDLRAENFLLHNGTIKISDFNNGQLLRWDHKKNERCHGFDWSAGCGMTMEQTNRKAPEECLDERNRTRTIETVEIYRFGAFLYYLISAGNWTYSYERVENQTLGRPRPETVKKMILSGKRPSLPPYVKESNSSDIKAIVRAMRMAHTYNARERPSAREIAEYLTRKAAKPRLLESPTSTTVVSKSVVR